MDSLFDNLILNKNIAIPLYYQLKNFMIENINSGALKEGDIVPPEDELCKFLEVSRPTVRQAFKELASEGYLERRRAKGTYITKPHIYGKFLNTLISFNSEMIEKGMKPTTKVLDFKVISSNEEIAEILKTKEKVIYLKRVRYGDNIPVVYSETYLPYDEYSKMLDLDMSKYSLYEKMNDIGKSVVRVERLIQASSADSFEAKQLNVLKNSPLLLCKTTGFASDETPIEYTIARYKGDSNKFKIELEVNS